MTLQKCKQHARSGSDPNTREIQGAIRLHFFSCYLLQYTYTARALSRTVCLQVDSPGSVYCNCMCNDPSESAFETTSPF